MDFGSPFLIKFPVYLALCCLLCVMVCEYQVLSLNLQTSQLKGSGVSAELLIFLVKVLFLSLR